jgi:hypothetical protein
MREIKLQLRSNWDICLGCAVGSSIVVTCLTQHPQFSTRDHQLPVALRGLGDGLGGLGGLDDLDGLGGLGGLGC